MNSSGVCDSNINDSADRGSDVCSSKINKDAGNKSSCWDSIKRSLLCEEINREPFIDVGGFC